MLLCETPQHGFQRRLDLVLPPRALQAPSKQVEETGGHQACCGTSSPTAKLHPRDMPGSKGWRQRSLGGPQACLSLASQPQGCPKSVGSCSPVFPGCHSQPQGCPLLPMKGSPGKPLGKNTNPYPPHPLARPCTFQEGGDMRKGSGELLMIQRVFSTDAFGRRGLQVSTWFGFGSPPPFQLIRLSTESVSRGC